MIPVSLATGWIHSVTFIRRAVAVGVGVGSLFGAAVARVDVKQEEEAAKREAEDMPENVVERMVGGDRCSARPGLTHRLRA
jgi:hypothetical protein